VERVDAGVRQARGNAAAAVSLSGPLEDYHRRKAMGEAPEPDQYREMLGDDYDEFVRILQAASVIDRRPPGGSGMGLPRGFGEYILLRELGRGAVGVVFDAIHRKRGTRVALKVLQTRLDADPIALARFEREARACAGLRHDHIVEVLDAGEAQGRPFFAMAPLSGITLAQAAKVRVDAAEIALAAAGVADALQALHDAGVVHRDVKPANIMLLDDGRMVLADFGLAYTVTLDGLTRTGEAMGTPLYMSPEQLVGNHEHLDGRTDVYGLGATLYEVLAGQPMFDRRDSRDSRDPRDLMRLILDERPPALETRREDIPPALNNIVMKAIEKRRDDRYPTAAALRDDLLALSRGEAVRGRPVSRTRELLRKLRRRRPYAL